MERLLVHADESEGSGAFLVFLPGVGEVTNLCERLGSHPSFAPRRGKHRIVPLHSRCTPAEQREAFKVPPRGVRKIVVATNVAETSVTIPDVVVVVDTGRVKERQWDPRRGMASLEEGWVSRAAAKQRAGRAGRVRPGKCFALYTSHRREEKMRSHQVPEMHRVPLTEIVLQIKKLRVGASAEGFLAGSIEPPNPAAVDAAVATLREVGAVWSVPREKGGSDEGELTPLGHHLATLPVDCRVAKMLVYAAVLSCLSPALTIAACLSYKSPFASGGAGGRGGGDSGAAARRALAAPAAKDAAAKTVSSSISSIAAGEQSDHLVYAAAYDGWARAWRDASATNGVNARAAANRYAAANGLDPETLRQIAEMRGQYASLLADAGFMGSEHTTRGAWVHVIVHVIFHVSTVGLGGRVGRSLERVRRSSARGQSRAVRGVVRERRRARRGRVHGPRAVARWQRGGWGAPRVAEREARPARGTGADAPVSGVSREGEDVEGFHPRLHDGGARGVAALRGGDGREARDRSGVSGRLAVAEGVRADRGAV